MLLRFLRDKFAVPLFCAASKRNCTWKRQGKITFCAPKSLSRLCFSIPMRACCCIVVGALVGSSQVWALWLQHGDSFAKGYAAMPSVSPNLKRKTAASRDGKIWPGASLYQPKFERATLPNSLYHPERVLIRQDASDRMMACTMFGCPSAVPSRSVVSANNLNCEGHGQFKSFCHFWDQVVANKNAN